MSIMLRNVRLSFVHVDEPTESQDGKLSYSVQALIPKNSEAAKILLAERDRATEEAKSGVWGGKPASSPWKVPRDGDTEGTDQYPERKGCWFINAKTGVDHKPALFLANGASAQKGDIYSGCYANIVVDIYGYESPDRAKTRGLSVSLKAVKKIRDGERFGATAISDDIMNELLSDESGMEGFDDDPLASPF